MRLIEIKDFNALIDDKWLFDHHVKSKQETYKKLFEKSWKYEYTAGNLLDYLYHQSYYKLIGIDLSRKKRQVFSQQINFKKY